MSLLFTENGPVDSEICRRGCFPIIERIASTVYPSSQHQAGILFQRSASRVATRRPAQQV